MAFSLVKRHRHEQPSGDSADGVSACPAEPSIRTPASSHVYPPSYATKPKPKPNVLRIEPHLADPQHITGDSATRLTRSSSTRSVVDPPTISGTSSSDVDDPPPTAGPSRRNVDHPSAGPPSHDIVTRRPVAGKAKLVRHLSFRVMLPVAVLTRIAYQQPKYDRQDKTHGGWAGSEGRGPIAAPPIFQNENDIRLGDVYHHQVPDDFQLWLRVLGEEGPYWLSVPAGYIRESDGRYLSVTQQKLEPSWITSIEWCNKCIRAGENPLSSEYTVRSLTFDFTVKRRTRE